MARGWGPGTAAIARSLLHNREPARQAALADECGVTQPRVSQVLSAFEADRLVSRLGSGWSADRPALIAAYMQRHRVRQTKPETFWYGLEPILSQASAVVDAAGGRAAVSADLAPDLVVPWRNPTTAIIWVAEPPAVTGLVPAESRTSSTIILRVTDDERLLDETTPVDGLPLANVLQQAIDLADLGGSDRLEAAARLLDRTIGTPR